MKIVYLTETDVSPGLALESMWPVLSTESRDPGTLSLEGFKEMARHLWEELMIRLKKVVDWIKEHLLSQRQRMERSRDHIESVMSGLGSLRAHRAPFDHVKVPLSGHEYRRLSRVANEALQPRMLQNAAEDMQKVATCFFEAHVNHVKAQCAILAEAFGRFDILAADTELVNLKAKLAALKIQGVEVGHPIEVVGLTSITAAPFHVDDVASLNLSTLRMLVQQPSTSVKMMSVAETLAVATNVREVLSKAINFHDHLKSDMEKCHYQLLHAGGLLMQHVKQMTEGTTDGGRIVDVVREMLKIEAGVAKTMAPCVVYAINWECETADAISAVLTRALHEASDQATPHVTSSQLALSAPTPATS